MPTVKSKYALNELEKEWKVFKPTLAPRTGVGEALKMIGGFDMKKITAMESVTSEMGMFNHAMETIHAAEKISSIKNDKNAMAFLLKAAETLTTAAKPLGQAKAGVLVYDKEKQAWVASASIKKQVTGK